MPTASLPLYTVLPFVLMLLAIAICPLAIPHWWESNRNKLLISIALGLPILGLYLGRRPGALLQRARNTCRSSSSWPACTSSPAACCFAGTSRRHR